MTVRGFHDAESPAVHPLLKSDFLQRHQAWLENVLNRPGGFDGERAVLEGFHYENGALTIRTAYRSYTEGLALRDSLRQARDNGQFPQLTTGDILPRPELSWGMSLTCYALLPGNYVLCAERDPNLISLPGLWTCSHTEIMEPSDIGPAGMQPLLERLVLEEMPGLARLTVNKFVGLSVRRDNYVWQLVGVVDLRHVDIEVLVPALLALQPDAETVGWSVYPLEAEGSVPNPYPESMQRSTTKVPVDFDIAHFLNKIVPTC